MRHALSQPIQTLIPPRRAAFESTSRHGDYPARPMTMLGVWAHPDDESYLSAVLMSRILTVGGRVVLATATRGERGGSGDPAELAVVRERELRTAMSSLCVRDVRFLGHQDGECSSVNPFEATASIIALIEEVRPDIVVTFGPDGITGHPDHVAVSKWTTAAAIATGHEKLLYATMTDDFLRSRDALHAELGVWMEGEPSSVASDDLALHIAPTPRERELKRRALHAHASQVSSLIDLVGEDVFDDWWVEEYFRRPTLDEWADAYPSLATRCLVS